MWSENCNRHERTWTSNFTFLNFISCDFEWADGQQLSSRIYITQMIDSSEPIIANNQKRMNYMSFEAKKWLD